VGKEAFFKATDHDDRELEALGAVQRQHENPGVLGARLFVDVRQQG